MGIRVSLDSTILVNTPSGWEKAKIKTKRDQTVRGLFTTYTTDLEFWGDGFDFIDNKLNIDYCETIDVLIETDDCDEGVFITEFDGTIILTQISKYDVDERIITTKIFDESFDAKIKNNKSIKAFVDVGVSKNGENIQALTHVPIEVFDPTDGFNTLLGGAASMFRVFDCFKFIIDYMTDGQVGFKSDLFAGKYFNWVLCNGKELRLRSGTGDQLEVSFKELFMELHKKTNISFAIEPTPTGYTDQFQLRLEETSFFEQDDAILTLDDVRGILMSFNKEELFSHVEIGSKDFDDNVVLSYPPINFKAFKEENYTILGNCNIDKPLNLVSGYIIDTNVIEDVVTNNQDKWDKKTFLIVTDGLQAIKYKEYDEPVSTGLDDAGTANRLTDSTADFNADGVVAGDMAVNMLTGLNANIDSIDAGGTFCILDTDIFNNGDEYQIRDRPFNYNDPLTNIRVIERFIGGLPNSVIKQFAVSATSNFEAGLTVTTVHNSFPVTINPIEYNDDSTPPFFDDGANYDNVTFEYTIPSSGLYGFEAKEALRMNGILGADEITNGDFSLGNANWFVGGGGNISGGQFKIQAGASLTPISFLKQAAFSSGNIYTLIFDCTITSGTILVHGNAITTSGTKTLILDFSISPAPPFLDFRFLTGSDGNAIIVIDNVSLFPTTRFTVTQSIIRSNSSGVQLQEFKDSFDFPFQIGQFQREEVLITQRTFSAFAGEKITVKTVFTKIKGNNTQITLLDELLGQLVVVVGETSKTSFKTILVDDGGGNILPVDPDTFPIYKYKFKKAMTFKEFKELRDAPEKAVLFSRTQTDHIFGFRNFIQYDRETGQGEFDLRAKVKINADC